MTGREQCAALCDLVETHEQDIDDERNEQQRHSLGETFTKDFLDTCGNSVLAVIRVDHACGQVEAVFKACQDRTEGGYQTAGTCIQDQHTDDRFQGAGKCVIPLLAHQAIAEQC